MGAVREGFLKERPPQTSWILSRQPPLPQHWKAPAPAKKVLEPGGYSDASAVRPARLDPPIPGPTGLGAPACLPGCAGQAPEDSPTPTPSLEDSQGWQDLFSPWVPP